jgi:hypothetical protein
MVHWLRPHFAGGNEIVDLFYAITDCKAGSGQQRPKSWFVWNHDNSRDGGKLRQCFAAN